MFFPEGGSFRFEVEGIVEFGEKTTFFAAGVVDMRSGGTSLVKQKEKNWDVDS